MDLREVELGTLRKRQAIATLIKAQNWSISALCAAAIIINYALLGRPITADILFSILFYSKLLTDPISWVTYSINVRFHAFLMFHLDILSVGLHLGVCGICQDRLISVQP